MKKYFIAILLITAVSLSGQSKDAKKLLDRVLHKFNRVTDYKADLLIKTDMSFIKIPEMNAKIFFKNPDKIKVDADGFAMIPKQGLKFSPSELLKGDFTALYVRSETMDNRKIDIVKTIPTSDSSEVILSTFWIDASESVIRKAETTIKKGITTQIELSYDNYEFGLPSQIKISFNLGNIQMPAAPNQQNENDASGANSKNKRRRVPDGASLKGSVLMTYKNYQINKGIPDSFFIEKEKEQKAKIN